MQIYFYRRSEQQPNFGDELNDWLWEKLLPGVFDDNENTAFLGIGSLLNHLVSERVPNARQIVVFSTGVGYVGYSGASYKEGMPKVDDSWKIYCVRGPFSAYKLGLPPEYAVTDGAVLVRRVFKPTEPKRYKYSYMPHFTQSIHGGQSWSEVCQLAGVNYIDARWPIEKVLTQISQTEVLLTEALHGAIIADSLRVPWICIQTALERLLPFKWQDWCESIQVAYRPYGLMELRDLKPQQGIQGIWKIRGSRAAIMTSLTHHYNKQKTAEKMIDLTQRVQPNLSDDAHIEGLTVELETRLERFKQDVQAGKFS
jgi:succinoglycan biosynthesis protein ExoV